ncbi:MAG: M48 family metallopeptidase [Thermodesulfobacteriota bacterium]|nr:M48 family metallopeptidase [Thermodesulfobacteriota bacterium]
MLFGEEKEVSLGKKADISVIKEFGFYDNPSLQSYINQIGQRLANLSSRSYLKFHFKLIDSPILNAFALPGGYIYISRGLIAEMNSEAQLAGVLAHEIGHVVCRHNINQLSQALSYQIITLAALAATPETREMAAVTTSLFDSILKGYSREKEFQADSIAVDLMQKAGYDVLEFANFFRNLARKSQTPIGYAIYNATHPDIFERIRRVIVKEKLSYSMEKALADSDMAEVKSPRFVGRKKYLKRLDGLVYGEKGRYSKLIIYKTEPGDTFYGIAEKILGDPRKALEIAEFNEIDINTVLPAGIYVKVKY